MNKHHRKKHQNKNSPIQALKSVLHAPDHGSDLIIAFGCLHNFPQLLRFIVITIQDTMRNSVSVETKMVLSTSSLS